MADESNCTKEVTYMWIAISMVCLAVVVCIVLVYKIIQLKRETTKSDEYTNITESNTTVPYHASGMQRFNDEKTAKDDALQRYKAEKSAKELEIGKRKRAVEKYEAEKMEKQKALQKYEEVEREKNLALQKYEDEKKEKDDALQRLSRLMSDRLTAGNPNIANLGDMKRPTKLAEEFSELYDNAWTDALGCIDGSHELKDNVQFLLQILKISFCWCRDRSNDQLTNLNGLLSCPSGLVDKTGSIQLNKEFVSKFKDERKRVAEQSVANVVAEVTKEVKRSFQQTEWKHTVQEKAVDAYCRECTELCWFMVVQDPSMDMDFDGVRRDDFKAFTQNGKVIDFVVWPPLYLYAGGGMVSKGVAQCH